MAGKRIGEAFLRVRPDLAGFAKDAQPGVGSAGTLTGKLFAGTFLRAFGGVSAAIAGVLSARAAIGFLRDSIEEQREAGRVTRLTEAVIKSTGGAAKVTANQVGGLADKLSLLAGVDDEAIQSGENLLLTFTEIKNVGSNKIFDETAKAALDMSAAMNNGQVTTEGYRGTILQVGKALNDPVRGMNSLRRAGVTFTEQQKEQVKHLVATGHTMDAQKIILKELAKEFGGAAAAAADPVQRAQVAWENFKERLGGFVLPIVGKLATVFTDKLLPAIETKIVPALQRLGAWFGANIAPKVRELAAVWLPRLVGAGKKVADGLKDLAERWGPRVGAALKIVGQFVATEVIPRLRDLAVTWGPRLALALRAVGDFIVGTLIPAFLAVAGWFTRNETLIRNLAIAIGILIVITKAHAAVMAVQAAGGILSFLATYLRSINLVQAATKVWTAVQWLLDVALNANPISLIIIGVVALIAIIVLVATKTKFFQTVWNASWGWIKNTVRTAGDWVLRIIQDIAVRVVRLANAFEEFRKGAVAKITAFIAFVKSVPGKILSAIGNLGSLLVNAGHDLITGLWDGIKSMGGWLKDKLIGFVKDRIPGPIAKVLEISSPSKLFARFGRDTVRGFALGFGDEAKKLGDKLGSALAVPPTLMTGAGAGRNGGGFNQTFNIAGNPPPAQLAAMVQREVNWVTEG